MSCLFCDCCIDIEDNILHVGTNLHEFGFLEQSYTNECSDITKDRSPLFWFSHFYAQSVTVFGIRNIKYKINC